MTMMLFAAAARQNPIIRFIVPLQLCVSRETAEQKI